MSETKKQEWSGSKSVSTLPLSGTTMSDLRKGIIRKALTLDIVDVRSYRGYKGDLLIEVTTIDNKVVFLLEEIAKALEVEIVIQQNAIHLFKVFFISPPPNSYELK